MTDPVDINRVPKLNLGLQETDEVFITRQGSGPYRVPASSFPWEQKGDKGDPGGSWAPVLALVTDGVRLVHRVVDWVGGTGEKPTALGYVGATGFVATAAAAVDVRGAQGAAGWAPVLAVVEDGVRRVHQVVDWTGGAGTKPTTLGYVGATGIVETAAAAVDVRGPQGVAGWAPVLAVVADGERRVQQVVDWTGGAGTKPTTLGYVGAAGIVETAAAAVDVRGAPGAAGWAPVLAVVADGERRVQQVVDWTGGAGTKPATLGYVGAAGIVETAAAAVDVRGAQGVAGWAPVLAVVEDGVRRVQRVVDWTGGAGTKPTTLGYVGAAGIVATAAAAVDVRGPLGTVSAESMREALTAGVASVVQEIEYLLSGGGNYKAERPQEFAPGNTYLQGVQVWRSGGQWDCNVTPESLIDTSAWVNTYYVNADTGSNANAGTAWNAPKAAIGSAMIAAVASGLPSRILVDGSAKTPYCRPFSPGFDGLVRTGSVPTMIEAINGRVETGVWDNLTWTATAGQTKVWQATRSNAAQCVNGNLRDSCGIPLVFTRVNSVAEVEATEGSWYTDNTTVWVRVHNDVRPDVRNTRVILTGTRSLIWQGNSNLLVRGVDFFGGPSGNVGVLGGSTNTVVLDDCTLRFACGHTSGGPLAVDAAPILGCGLFAAFDCDGSHANKDIWNLHKEGSVVPSGLLVRCKGRFAGRLDTSVSNNGVTAHDGVKLVSVGGEYLYNRGTAHGHVNSGTQVWAVGDTAGASLGDLPNGGGIGFAGFGAWDGSARLWLDSCRDIGANVGIHSGSGGAQVYVRNHRGSGQRSGSILPY